MGRDRRGCPWYDRRAMGKGVDRLFASPLAGGLLSSPAASIVVAEWTDPGGGHDPPRYIAPLHLHRSDDEAWYVLDGTLRVRAGDRDVEVSSGGAVLVPRGTVHTYWNPSPDATRYLLVMTPGIARLIEAIHESSSRDATTLATTFAAHDSEYLGWP
jgi:mannose-6-phosphate isomerase-like protein (cupin superfamily)